MQINVFQFLIVKMIEKAIINIMISFFFRLEVSNTLEKMSDFPEKMSNYLQSVILLSLYF